MSQRTAFSLVELSIVLVILGLLTGGILAGQSLIRASELRSVSTEFSRFVTARTTFRDKYFAIPGDMANAHAFWGNTCGTNTTAPSTGCNGNGNGIIETANTTGEPVKAWEHLARAGLVEGGFDGTGTVINSGDSVALNASNVPFSKLPKGAWDMSNFSGNCVGSDGCAKTFMSFGELYTGGDSETVYPHPTLKHEEAWNIDTKMDDGRANAGFMRGDSGDMCYDTGTDYYNIAAAGGSYTGDCMFYFQER